MAVLLTVPLMVMVSEWLEDCVKVLLESTGFPDLRVRWLLMVNCFYI